MDLNFSELIEKLKVELEIEFNNILPELENDIEKEKTIELFKDMTKTLEYITKKYLNGEDTTRITKHLEAQISNLFAIRNIRIKQNIPIIMSKFLITLSTHLIKQII